MPASHDCAAPISAATVSAPASTSPTPLRPLQPEAPVATTGLTPRTRVLAALTRVSSVRIRSTVKQDGHRFYVVELQFQHHALGSRVSSPPTIQWRFADFMNLENELYYHVRASHRHHQKRPCEFCKHALDALKRAPALPGLHHIVLASTETVCTQLERFVNAVLQLAQSAKHFRELACCPGLGMVPLLAKRFLLGKGNEAEEDEAEASAATRSACGVDPFRPVASAGLAFS